jgi:hypothetical protein
VPDDKKPKQEEVDRPVTPPKRLVLETPTPKPLTRGSERLRIAGIGLVVIIVGLLIYGGYTRSHKAAAPQPKQPAAHAASDQPASSSRRDIEARSSGTAPAGSASDAYRASQQGGDPASAPGGPVVGYKPETGAASTYPVQTGMVVSSAISAAEQAEIDRIKEEEAARSAPLEEQPSQPLVTPTTNASEHLPEVPGPPQIQDPGAMPKLAGMTATGTPDIAPYAKLLSSVGRNAGDRYREQNDQSGKLNFTRAQVTRETTCLDQSERIRLVIASSCRVVAFRSLSTRQ